MPDVTAKGGVIRVVISRWRKMVRKPTRGNRQKKDGRHGGEMSHGAGCEIKHSERRVVKKNGKNPHLMMMLFIGTHSVTTTLNVHSPSRSFVSAIDLRGLAPSMRLFRRPNTNGMKK